jgi:hypothetical protein
MDNSRIAAYLERKKMPRGIRRLKRVGKRNV